MQGHCPPHRGGGPLKVALLSMLTVLSGCGDAAGTATPWLAATLLTVLAAGAGFAAGNMRGRRENETALRRARETAQARGDLIDAWSWQTDAGHRLSRLQPPAGAAAAEWARSPGVGVTLWERFESDVPGDVAGLRARLESHGAFHELRARQASDSSRWLLRATPRFDDQGRFAGYEGTARPTAEIDAMQADQLALSALLAALDGPALLAVGDGTPGGWRLRHANAAAQALFDGSTPPWPKALARLPAPVSEAVATLAAGASGECEDWLLRRIDAEGAAGLVLLKSTQAAADDGRAETAAFSFTVSHDLRAPIRVVEGFTRILKEDYGRQLDRVGNDHLDRVLSAAARMNQMIDALLTLARLSQQPLARQPVNLSQLAGFVVEDLRRAFPERAAEVEIEPGLETQGDPTLLRLVLENLLGNAWKYTARCKKAHIVFGAAPHEGRRAFVVRDNGAGFDMRSADRLFGLFQRLHSANDFAGTGVGLASVKRIVRRHGGDVWADAEPGQGAAFHFTLRE